MLGSNVRHEFRHSNNGHLSHMPPDKCLLSTMHHAQLVTSFIYEKVNAYMSLPIFATNNISPDCSLALAPLLELAHPDSLQYPYQALRSGWRPKPPHHQSDAVPRCAHLPWQAVLLHAPHQPAAALLLLCLSTILLFSLSLSFLRPHPLSFSFSTVAHIPDNCSKLCRFICLAMGSKVSALMLGIGYIETFDTLQCY